MKTSAALFMLVAAVAACASKNTSAPATPVQDNRVIVELKNQGIYDARVYLLVGPTCSFTNGSFLGEVSGAGTRIIRVNPVVFNRTHFNIFVRLVAPAGINVQAEGCPRDGVMVNAPRPGDVVAITIPSRLNVGFTSPVVYPAKKR